MPNFWKFLTAITLDPAFIFLEFDRPEVHLVLLFPTNMIVSAPVSEFCLRTFSIWELHTFWSPNGLVQALLQCRLNLTKFESILERTLEDIMMEDTVEDTDGNVLQRTREDIAWRTLLLLISTAVE